MSAGAKVASHAMGNLFATEAEKSDRFKDLITSQVDRLSRELGQLKGSLMKVGQLLSMYGEHFLPPEANALLKSLQSQSPPLEWKAIEKVVKKQISPEVLLQLEVDPIPLASASLGQVHRATRKSDGLVLAMKVQYPGVDRAIEGDLKALRSLLMISKLLPTGPKYDLIFDEVRTMLHQEVDYRKEFKTTEYFRTALASDGRFIVPQVLAEYSTKRILTSTLEEGVAVDSPEVLGLSQERRNQIGAAALELYFRELFEFGAVQTDPHFGNYRVRLGAEGQPDRLVLLDFGAVRKLGPEFKKAYFDFVTGALAQDAGRVVQAATDMGFLQPQDSPEQKKAFVDFCLLILEPFFTPQTRPEVPAHLYDATGAYSWGDSDLPKRAARLGTQLAFLFKLRSPPQEIVFLDRKLGGIFIFLSVLRVKLRNLDVISPFIDKSSASR